MTLPSGTEPCPPTPKSRYERLAQLETPDSSSLEEMGYSNQVLASDLRPLDNERRLAGIAFSCAARTAS